MTILNQLATLRASKLAAFVGLLIGGFVPVAVYVTAHYYAPVNRMLWCIVAGGLLYSALTVYDWSVQAGNHPVKAVGFVVLLEASLTFSPIGGIAYAALGILVLVNGVAIACQLVVARDAELQATKAAQKAAKPATVRKPRATVAPRKRKAVTQPATPDTV